MTVLCAIGMQGWRSIFNNFAVEVVDISGQEMGMIQSIREIPGFLALLAVYLLLFIKEHKLAAVSLLIMGLGVCLTGYLASFWGIVITTLIFSFGFHYYETMNQSLTLQYFSKTTTPLILAKLKSIKSISNIIIGLVVFGLAYVLDYVWIFLLIGIFVCAGALWCLFQNPTNQNIEPQHKKMIIKKEYWLFYILTMLAGARRQIFVAFAVFLLVKKFAFSIFEVTGLFVINNLVVFWLMPYVGKLINKKGEKFVLSIEYVVLIFVFLTYAFTGSKIIAAIAYIIDHLVFGFSIAISSYFQKTADKKDIAPSMALGFTINHIVAVILPAIGGLLWMVDYKIPFLIGVVLSILSLICAQKMKPLSD